MYELARYTSSTAPRTYNSQDRIYTERGGSRVLLTLTKLGSKVSDGFLGVITLVLDPEATPASVGISGGGGGH